MYLEQYFLVAAYMGGFGYYLLWIYQLYHLVVWVDAYIPCEWVASTL